jgi:hypothetical protein
MRHASVFRTDARHSAEEIAATKRRIRIRFKSRRLEYQMERPFSNCGEGPFRVPGTRLAKKVKCVRSLQTKPDATNRTSETVPAEGFREFKRPVVLVPNWYNASSATQNVRAKPGLVARVGAEGFGLDPARLTVPPLDALDLPHLRAAMAAVDAELTAGGAGGGWSPSRWPTSWPST